MEQLVINLDEYQKLSKGGKILNIIIGSGMIILPSWVIYKKIAGGGQLGDYFIFLVFAIAGLNVLFYTFGIFYRISRRYVVVNNKGVEYKLSYIYPSTSISWRAVKKVDIKTLRIFFHTGHGSPSRMKLGEIFYSDIRKLKHVLADCCTEKGIEWSDTTVESELASKERKEKTS